MARINLTDRRIAALKPDPSYAALLKEYGVTEVTGDGYSGSWVETAFQGIRAISPTASEKNSVGRRAEFELKVRSAQTHSGL